ncbi:unnamed protein product [Amaranthus hypochondriacus]
MAFRPIDKMDLRKSKKNGLQRKVLGAIYNAVIYHIWLNRNAAIWNGAAGLWMLLSDGLVVLFSTDLESLFMGYVLVDGSYMLAACKYLGR